MNPNTYTTEGTITRLTVTRNDGRSFTAIIDTSGLSTINKYQWHAQILNSGDSVYLFTQKSLIMARLLMQPPDGKLVGYLNGDTLDCRRSNLYVCTRAEISKRGRNAKNPTSVPNVIHKGDQYMARGYFRDTFGSPHRIYLGIFPTLDAAAKAVNEHDAKIKRGTSRPSA